MNIGFLIFFANWLFYQKRYLFYSSDEEAYKLYIDGLKSVVYSNVTDLFGDAFEEFVNCTVDELDLNTTGFAEGYYNQPVVLVGVLIQAYGSVANATNTTLADCAEENEEVASFLNDTETVMRYENDDVKDLIESLGFLTTAKYETAAVIGFFGGLLIAFYVAGVLIPSYISTVLKVRSGVIPTLRDRDFQRYREALDTVTVLLGVCFWGSLFSSVAGMLLTMALVRSILLSKVL